MCVILNGTTKNLMKNDFSATSHKEVTLNKFYVALTRSRGDLYIVTPEEFDVIKNEYIK